MRLSGDKGLLGRVGTLVLRIAPVLKQASSTCTASMCLCEDTLSDDITLPDHWCWCLCWAASDMLPPDSLSGQCDVAEQTPCANLAKGPAQLVCRQIGVCCQSDDTPPCNLLFCTLAGAVRRGRDLDRKMEQSCHTGTDTDSDPDTETDTDPDPDSEPDPDPDPDTETETDTETQNKEGGRS